MATVTLHQPLEEIKIYQVKKIQGDELLTTGIGDSPQWKYADNLTDFAYPWENGKPTSTSFKALHGNNWLYCLYEVQDENVNIYVNTNDKIEVINSDRVEIFFKQDDRLSPYYCLELDPSARIMDYEAEYHRKFNMAWSWPSGQLIVKSNRTKVGYTVEIAIHKESLKKIGVLKGKNIEAGLFRAECVELIGANAKMKWISWVKPKSDTPDFHISSSFGVLRLED